MSTNETTATTTSSSAAEPAKTTDPRFPIAQIIGTVPMNVCQNWNDWLSEWQDASFLHRLGLLETGLMVSGGTNKDDYQQLQFFLTLSDRETEQELCKRNTTEWEALNMKATEILVREVFTNQAHPSSEFSWTWLLDKKELFELVLWYFRPKYHVEQISISAITHTKSEKEKEVLQKFLRDFCRLAWNNEMHCGRPWLKEKLPQLVPVLCGLGGTAIWEATDPFGVIKFDDACMKALQQTVLSIKVTSPRDRSYHSPKNIEDSVTCGIECARVFLVLQTMNAEKLRYEKIDSCCEQARELREQLILLETELTSLGADPKEKKPESPLFY